MKVWRNAEGRELPAEVFHGRDIAKVGHFALSAHAMRSLGYELVEDSPDSSVTAEQVGAPSANDGSVRLSQRDVLRLLGAFNQVQQEFLDKIRKVSKPPQNPPTEAVSVGTEGADEFEVVCVENREASERWPHLTPVLIHVGLIPGKTYVVREKR